MDQGDTMETDRDGARMKAILVVAAALAFATAPFWSAGFGGFDPNAFPIPQDDPPVQPLGYAFSIWSVIYLWLIGGAVFGLLSRAEAADWDRMRWPLILSLVVGVPWISVAMVSPVWATVLIWAMLGGALAALLTAPRRDPWWGAAPVGLYAGWLTAASAVSLGLMGAGYGIGPGETGWAWIALIVALVLGTAVSRARPDVGTYPLGLAWALVAVAGRNWGADWALVALAALGALWFLGRALAGFRAARG